MRKYQLRNARHKRTSLRRILLLFVVLMAALTACGGAVVDETVQTASYEVQLQLEQLALGDQAATVQVRDRAGQPVSADEVTVTPLMEAMGMASPEVSAAPTGAGQYQTEEVYFSMTGDWEIDVRVFNGGAEEVARFRVVVPEP